MKRLLIRALRPAGVDLRADEVGIATALFSYSFAVGVFQFASKAVRQATFVDALGAEKLPPVYLLVALTAYPAMRAYNAISDRCARGLLVAGTTWSFGALLVMFWWLMRSQAVAITVAYYLFTSIATVLALSQLWSFTGSVLDFRQARRLFGFIGSGSLLGGVAGGQIVRFSGAEHPRAALLAAATVLFAIGAVVLASERRAGDRLTITGRRIGRSREAAGTGTEAPHVGLATVLRTPHLLVIATVLALTVIVSQVIDLQFNWVVEGNTTNLQERAAVFGNLYSTMGLAAFLFQLLLTARIHRLLGVGFAMRVLPVFVLLTSLALSGAAFLAVAPALLLAVVSTLKVGETGLRYSLDHVTRELLFVAVPPSQRPLAKSYIDVIVHRFAKGLAAIGLLTVTVGWLSPLGATALSIVLALVWIGATYKAQRRYIGSLRTGLARRASSTLDPGELLDSGDVTTLEVLVESLGSTEPDRVLQALELLEKNGRAHLVPPLLLYHDDEEVRRRTLRVLTVAGRDDAVPLIERCLADESGAVRAAAVLALSSLLGTEGPNLMAQRVEDPDPRVRAAAIACLFGQGSAEQCQVAERSLAELLSGEQPEWRLQAAEALGELTDSRHDSYLVRLLFDEDPDVVRSAIDAVRRRTEAGAASPLFPPILISLLRDRRLKHEAREALVSFGEAVVPALAHFLNEESEQIWVRRGLPKTLARIRCGGAIDALFHCLDRSADPMLRRKAIEALERLRPTGPYRERAEKLLISECERYARCLTDLASLGEEGRMRCVGPTLTWHDHEPSLLEQLIDERRRDHCRNVFRLLSVTCVRDGTPLAGVDEAYRRLLGADAALRARAIEYIDNLTEGVLRRPVLLVIDDLPLIARLDLAERLFGVVSRPRLDVLRALLRDVPEENEGEAWLVSVAIHESVAGGGTAEGRESLAPIIKRLAAGSENALVRETARWACERVIA